MTVTGKKCIILHTGVGNNSSNDQTVDTQDTSHNTWNNTSHDKILVDDTQVSNTNTCLSSTVCTTKICELNKIIY